MQGSRGGGKKKKKKSISEFTPIAHANILGSLQEEQCPSPTRGTV